MNPRVANRPLLPSWVGNKPLLKVALSVYYMLVFVWIFSQEDHP